MIASLTLRGYKTVREIRDFRPGPLTVLIGPNGAGKSNLISFFRFMSWAVTPPGQLQEHIAKMGGASALLHDGPQRTRDIEAHLRLTTKAGDNEYCFRLAYAAGDTLIYTDERYRFAPRGLAEEANWTSLGAGHRESRLIEHAGDGRKTASTILSLLRQVICHQFHNTSDSARIRQKWYVDEGRWLKEDAGNLGPFLFRIRREAPGYYQRILESIRLVLPFFADFELEPEYDRILLRWREIGSDHVFSAGQAADGMLRIMALISLLQQPEPDLPEVLVLDEPELGLHPYAIEILAGLIRSASRHTQIMIATQSVSLIDRFTPDDIVVVDRRERESSFRRLGTEQLRDWLADYTLSELWEKNVLGGRPSA